MLIAIRVAGFRSKAVITTMANWLKLIEIGIEYRNVVHSYAHQHIPIDIFRFRPMKY